jgi:hypothetical protein
MKGAGLMQNFIFSLLNALGFTAIILMGFVVRSLFVGFGGITKKFVIGTSIVVFLLIFFSSFLNERPFGWFW